MGSAGSIITEFPRSPHRLEMRSPTRGRPFGTSDFRPSRSGVAKRAASCGNPLVGITPWLRAQERMSGRWAENGPWAGDLSLIGPLSGVAKSKVFRRREKDTLRTGLQSRVGKELEMAADLLRVMADEVARNGAFRKKLRPEVFPGAPLQSALAPAPCPVF